MAIHIHDMYIDSFRGISKLEISKLNHINFVLGNNNCGKTSFLEAIMLFKNPSFFSNLVQVSRFRAPLNFFLRESLYISFMTMFPICHRKRSDIDVCCTLMQEKHSIKVFGEDQILHVNSKDFDYVSVDSIFPMECIGFSGQYQYKSQSSQKNKKFVISELEKYGKYPKNKNSLIKINYLQPFSHLLKSSITELVQNEQFKNLCIAVLQQIDPGIQDLLLIKDQFSNSSVECIKHKDTGIMPLSSYGDGIKKVLNIVTGLVASKDGILLIDEVETAIHTQYFSKIIDLIIQTAQKLNIQVFMTTHNIEVIDLFLKQMKYQDSEDDQFEDILSVITLKKISERTYSRILSGYEVAQNRRQFGFEVRL